MNKNVMQVPWTVARRIARAQPPHPLQQHRACPVCGQDDTRLLSSLTDFQFFTDQDGLNRADHNIVACNECGLLYTNPCYTADGFQLLFEKAGCSYGHTAGRIQEQVDWLLHHFDGATSIMDIGCGSGDLLNALPPTLQRYGLDVDAHTLEQAAQRSPQVQFSVCDFEGLSNLPQVEVITMFHVLEHLADPGGFLRQLRAEINASVSLVIEVPVLDRAAHEQDRDIVGFFTIQHLTHFSQYSLDMLMKASGWQITHSEAMDGYNGWRVVATPMGPDSRQIVKDAAGLNAAMTYLAVWQDNVTAVRQRIEVLNGVPQIMVWGAGQHTEYLALLTGLFDLDAQLILVDSDPLKQGHNYHGVPVLSPDQVPADAWLEASFPIVISTYGGQDSVLDILLSKGVARDRVVTLYDRTRRY